MVEPNTKFRLQLGQVVWDRECGERGVVVRARGHGDPNFVFGGHVCSDDCVIMVSAGHFIVTNDQGEHWRPVPAAATSALERVRSAARTYELPTWLEDGDEPRDLDSFPYALVRALLPPAIADEVMDGDVPSFYDLVEVIAERFDKLQDVRPIEEAGGQ